MSSFQRPWRVLADGESSIECARQVELSRVLARLDIVGHVGENILLGGRVDVSTLHVCPR